MRLSSPVEGQVWADGGRGEARPARHTEGVTQFLKQQGARQGDRWEEMTFYIFFGSSS